MTVTKQCYIYFRFVLGQLLENRGGKLAGNFCSGRLFTYPAPLAANPDSLVTCRAHLVAILIVLQPTF